MNEVVRNRRAYNAPLLPSSCAQEASVTSRRFSALVEKERRGRMPQGMSGNNRQPRSLAGQLEACVECLVVKRNRVPARTD